MILRAPNSSHFDVPLATSISGADEALYNVGGGQWHHEMGFSDPYFGSTQNMVSTYNTVLGKNPPYDGAACMAAGVFAQSVVDVGFQLWRCCCVAGIS